MRTKYLRRSRLPIILLISLLGVISLVLVPSPALGLQVNASVTGTSFPLGDQIPVSLDVTLVTDEVIAANVQLQVTGPQNVTFSLPIAPGAFALNVNGSTLTGTVVHTSLQTGFFTGYGYGYKALTSTAKVEYQNLGFVHRVLLSPVPDQLALLPQATSLFDVNDPGALSGGGGGGGGGLATFPDFDPIGTIFAPGTAFDSKARALDSRIIGPDIKLGAILDGVPGAPDVFALLNVDPAFFGVDTSFSLPPLSGGFVSGLPGASMSEVAGLGFINDTTIAVAGGEAADGSDAFLAILALTGSSPFFTGATIISELDISGSLTKPVGGVAFDPNPHIYVSEFQDDPSQLVKVVKVDVSTLGSPVVTTTIQTPLGFSGLGGFDGLGRNPHTGSFFGATEPALDGFGAPINNAAIIEFAANGNPIATYFLGSFPPFGQAITGIGLTTNPLTTGDPIDALMFVVTRETREVLIAQVSAAATGPGAGQFSNEPGFVDKDPVTSNYFIGVQGIPSRVQVIQDDGTVNGSILNTFVLPSGQDNIDGGTLVPAFNPPAALWIADNSTGQVVLRKLDPTDGSELDTITLPFFIGEIGGLAHQIEDQGTAATTDDVVVLLAYERFNDNFHKVDTVTKVITQSVPVFDQNFSDPFFPPFGADGASIVQVGGIDKLFIAKFNQVYQVNPATGALEAGFNTALFDIQGLGTGSLLMANRGGPTGGQIFGSRLPGDPQSELTTAGAYTMQASVTIGATTDNSTVSNFTLVKLGQVALTLTQPTDNQAFVASPITFAGTVDDPTVTQVQIGQDLAVGTLVGAPAASPTGPSPFTDGSDQAQYTPAGLWHFTTNLPVVTAGATPTGAVAYYGQGEPGSPNFNTGSTNTGTLTTPAFDAKTGAKLFVDVWYQTEPGFDFDKKIFQFCETGAGCTTFLQIVDFPSSLFFGTGGGGTPGETFAGPFGFDFAFVPNNRLDGSSNRLLTPIQVGLNQFAGKNGTIQVLFNSVDNIGNDGAGLVIDNLEVTGPKFVGQAFPVTNKAFNFNLAIADGSNSTTLTASSGVPGTANGAVTVTTFLDTQAPVVTLDAVTSPTATNTQTLTGTFVESNPQVLEIKVNGKVVESKKTFTAGDNTFSKLIALDEGANAVEVQMTDLAGRLSDSDAGTAGDQPETASIVLDTTAPLIQAAVVPIESSSSVRVDDPYFILVNAVDSTAGGATATGISKVELNSGSTLVQFAPIASVPEVIVKKHGLGTFGASVATTHVLMTTVPSGTPTGLLGNALIATDGGGNTVASSVNATVVATLPDRNVYLSEGFNFVGFPLIADTPPLATLLDQDVTNVSATLVEATQALATPRNPKLSDIVETVQTWSGGPSSGTGAGAFLIYNPIGADTLTDIAPFLGLIVKVKSTVDVDGAGPIASVSVFDTAPDPSGASSDVKVPVAWNATGLVLNPGSTPPTKDLVTGFNLWTLHAEQSLSFDFALRGALIPTQLAVSAITQTNLINAVADTSVLGGFGVDISQGFQSNFPGSSLKPTRAYWTLMAGNATISP